jgi:hypothetical protein
VKNIRKFASTISIALLSGIILFLTIPQVYAAPPPNGSWDVTISKYPNVTPNMPQATLRLTVGPPTGPAGGDVRGSLNDEPISGIYNHEDGHISFWPSSNQTFSFANATRFEGWVLDGVSSGVHHPTIIGTYSKSINTLLGPALWEAFGSTGHATPQPR